MLATPFKAYEEEIREHLGGMLPKPLFDFDRDVRSISINRSSAASSLSPDRIGVVRRTNAPSVRPVR